MNFYIIVRKTSSCYGHGDYRDELVLEVQKLFTTIEDAKQFIKENNIYPADIIEIKA